MTELPAGTDPTAVMQSVLDGYRTLLAFQETFEAPAGVGMREFMRACVDVMNACPPSVDSVTEVTLREADGWRLRAEVTSPASATATPVIVFFHGGGWSMGNPATHRRLANDLTLSGCAVVSVDYRRLPKYRFPAQLEDALFAIEWVAEHSASHGWDATRIVLAGDSAGATIAAAAAQTLGESGAVQLNSTLLMYGILDYHEALDLMHPSVLRHPQEAGQGYLAPEQLAALRTDARVSPLHGCSRLPATYLSTGGRDPLAGQTRRMAAALDAHGIVNELHVLPDAPHGFMQLPFLGSYLIGQLTVHSFLRRYAGGSSR